VCELRGGDQRPALHVWFRRDRRLTEARRGRVSYREAKGATRAVARLR
jgi:hypothetical protein